MQVLGRATGLVGGAVLLVVAGAGLAPLLGLGAVTANATAASAYRSPALCAASDKPEPGIQGDVAPPGGDNCGLALLSSVSGGGSVGVSGHCAYVRTPGRVPYTGSLIQAFDISDPLHPVATDSAVPTGGSESMRVATVPGRAMLVSGSGVYDVSNCTHLVRKGTIDWPSVNARANLYVGATVSHEIAISHDAKRIYSGLGFGIAEIPDLNKPSTWTVRNYTCQLDQLIGFLAVDDCDTPAPVDQGAQFSHSSDDNFAGTRWYGAGQKNEQYISTRDGTLHQDPASLRIVDISRRPHLKVLGTLPNIPGHSMAYWRAPDGREFVLSANELGPGDTCEAYPRPVDLMHAADGYVTEVTHDHLVRAGRITVAIDLPQNCAAAKASGSQASYSATTVYNVGKTAFAMIEYSGGGSKGAGLRIWDLRDGYHPKEVAYFNDSQALTHSGTFHYDPKTGIVAVSSAHAMQLLVMEPQVVKALGLPTPTDRRYPYLRSLKHAATKAAASGHGTTTHTGRTSASASSLARTGLDRLIVLVGLVLAGAGVILRALVLNDRALPVLSRIRRRRPTE